MDQQEQGPDQRKQRLKRNKRGRTREEWELIALKVQLFQPEWAAWVRDNYRWKMYVRDIGLQRQIPVIMRAVTVTDCQPSTFITAVARSLRNMKCEARQVIQDNKRDHQRDRDK